METIQLIEMKEEDLVFVKEIYDYYILHSTAIFYLHPLTLDELRTNISIGDDRYKSFIIQYKDCPCGFCYISKFKPKEAFDITVEVTIYLKPDWGGKGIGYKAMTLFEPKIWQAGFHNIVALITGGNTASIKLFEKCGYNRCAHIEEVALKFNRLLDLDIYQKRIEK